MTTVSFDRIKELAEKFGPNYHDSTIAYVQELVSPYAEAMVPAINTDQIIDWLPTALGNSIGTWLVDVIRDELDIIGENIEDINHPQNVLYDAKDIVIYTLADTLLEISYRSASVFYDNTVFPWDINAALNTEEHNDLAHLFGVPKAEDALFPITVTVNFQQYTHMLNLNFIGGLLASSLPSVTNSDFDITIMGYRLSRNYLLGPNRFTDIRNRNLFMERFHNDPYIVPATYTINIMNTTYVFLSIDFMRGFTTGTLWVGVDHYNYWRDLMMYNREYPDGIPVTF